MSERQRVETKGSAPLRPTALRTPRTTGVDALTDLDAGALTAGTLTATGALPLSCRLALSALALPTVTLPALPRAGTPTTSGRPRGGGAALLRPLGLLGLLALLRLRGSGLHVRGTLTDELVDASAPS